ncbi:WYL domain-containing protein [Alcanivorax sp.]|uniref:helix-turn-helix transcriptional regulator n=1 Tax=Alcanivorax sp. TaxID=1872427 RepID=UPI0032D920D8
MQENSALTLENHSHAQRERLAFIDFRLQYHGAVGRSELMAHFGTAVASSTRDFTLYRELAQENLILRHENKRYYRTDSFQPLFHHAPRTALKALTDGFGDGISATPEQSGFCEDAPDLIAPPQEVLATLSRAISLKLAVQVSYQSLTSGASTRVIVPHSIVNNGQRWHIRGYCRKRGEFRDFVCNRIISAHTDEKGSDTTKIAKHEQQAADAQWNQQLTLELVPHPGHKHPQAIALDYGMQVANTSRQNNPPVRQLSIRAARAGYLLRHWNVDCSPDHRLPAHEHHLWLRNHPILEHCANAVLAPGYAGTGGKAAASL